MSSWVPEIQQPQFITSTSLAKLGCVLPTLMRHLPKLALTAAAAARLLSLIKTFRRDQRTLQARPLAWPIFGWQDFLPEGCHIAPLQIRDHGLHYHFRSKWYSQSSRCKLIRQMTRLREAFQISIRSWTLQIAIQGCLPQSSKKFTSECDLTNGPRFELLDDPLYFDR